MNDAVTLLSQFRRRPAQQSQHLGEDDVVKKWYARIVKECRQAIRLLRERLSFLFLMGSRNTSFPEPFRRGNVLYGQQTTE
ncbi:hypothetical protein [Ferviditalea candida]|uniref:Uncharacterized protein n=1 Tax=Ferviditalea candida TaxID=3108399 RepID=A0ABU5ZK09_9BACL|nr:hypothetical protein [Paenibacillaceae bacterium T2]